VVFPPTESLLRILGRKRMYAPLKRPVFIVGPARAGTTLLYGLLAGSRTFSCLTRLDELFPAYPRCSRLMLNLLRRKDEQNEYASLPGTIGAMSGQWPPTEGLFYWRHHMDELEHKADPRKADRYTVDDAGPDRARALRDDLAVRLASSAGERFLFKRPAFSLRIPFVDAVFPDALFIHCLRDPFANWRSLCDIKRSTGQIDWGTCMPDRADLANQSLERQSAEQLFLIYDMIMKDINMLSVRSERYARVWYEDLIPDPIPEVRRLCAFVGAELPSESSMRKHVRPRDASRDRSLHIGDEQVLARLEQLRERMNKDSET
jgi:hypothetical protein